MEFRAAMNPVHDAAIVAQSVSVQLRDNGTLLALVIGDGPDLEAFMGGTLVVSFFRGEMRFGCVRVRPDPADNPWREFFAAEDVPYDFAALVEVQRIIDMVVMREDESLVEAYTFVYVPWRILRKGSMPVIPSLEEIERN